MLAVRVHVVGVPWLQRVRPPTPFGESMSCRDGRAYVYGRSSLDRTTEGVQRKRDLTIARGPGWEFIVLVCHGTVWRRPAHRHTWGRHASSQECSLPFMAQRYLAIPQALQ